MNLIFYWVIFTWIFTASNTGWNVQFSFSDQSSPFNRECFECNHSLPPNFFSSNIFITFLIGSWKLVCNDILIVSQILIKRCHLSRGLECSNRWDEQHLGESSASSSPPAPADDEDDVADEDDDDVADEVNDVDADDDVANMVDIDEDSPGASLSSLFHWQTLLKSSLPPYLFPGNCQDHDDDHDDDHDAAADDHDDYHDFLNIESILLTNDKDEDNDDGSNDNFLLPTFILKR